jgi:hypothetical protein
MNIASVTTDEGGRGQRSTGLQRLRPFDLPNSTPEIGRVRVRRIRDTCDALPAVLSVFDSGDSTSTSLPSDGRTPVWSTSFVSTASRTSSALP